MEKKRNKFFIFLFSLVPGAGEMYMGAMGKGTVLMLIFFLWLGICFSINLEYAILLSVVIWFYSFLDTHRLKTLSDDEIKEINDSFIKKLSALFSGAKQKGIFRYKYLGYLIIIIAVFALFNSVMRLLWEYYYLTYAASGIFVSFIILLVGIHIVKKSVTDQTLPLKEDTPNEDNFEKSHIAELISEEDKFCPNCNEIIFEGNNFCPNCGVKLTSDEKLCASCGNKLSENAKFCPECGKKAE